MRFRFLGCVLVVASIATCVLSNDASAQIVGKEVQQSLQSGFDVASIRPMREGDASPSHITNSAHSGYIKAVNVNLKALMEIAYGIPDLRMYGGPDWITKDTFSLEATGDTELNEQMAGISSEQGKEIKRKMLAALLADRFKLAVHTETRKMPIYAMVIGKGGPKLSADGSGTGTLSGDTGRITVPSGHDSLAILAYELSWRLGRPVIDRTGLQYRQRLTLGWKEEDGTSEDSDGPSLFTAIQEELGLKLEPTRGSVPVLIIDHAERPSEN